MSTRPDRLDREQMIQVISFLTNRMDHELRRELMAALPQAYNVLVDQEILRVVHVSDSRPVMPTKTVLTDDGRFEKVPVTYGGGL